MQKMFCVHFRSWEIVDPRKLKDSTADIVLLSMVRGVGGGSVGGLCLKSTFRIRIRILLLVIVQCTTKQKSKKYKAVVQCTHKNLIRYVQFFLQLLRTARV